MDLDEFREQCEGVVMGKLEKPCSLAEEASEFWDPISDRRVHNHKSDSSQTGSASSASSASSSASNNSTSASASDAALRSSRLEAAAIRKVSKHHAEAALYHWLLGPQAACLQVHVVGRAFVSAPETSEQRSDRPSAAQVALPLGIAKVTITDRSGSEVYREWEGPVEDCAAALGEEVTFPCFVSGE